MKHYVKLALRHKNRTIMAGVLLVLAGFLVYHYASGDDATVRYAYADVSKGALIVSISGSGQVSASSQVDIQPKISGDVVYVGVKEGQKILAGQLIARINSSDAEKTIRDAEANLRTAEIALEKLKQPADSLSIIQAENSLSQAVQSKQGAEEDLVKAYDDGFNAVANAFMDLPGIVTGLNDILNGTEINSSQSNAYAYYDMIKTFRPDADLFRDIALDSYQDARTIFEKNLLDYKNASRYSNEETIESLISETYNTTKAISEAIKNAKSYIDLVDDTFSDKMVGSRPPAMLATHSLELEEHTSTANAHLGSILNINNSIRTSHDAVTNAERTIAEKTQSLADLKSGPDSLDLESQEISIQQKKNSLTDARENLLDYYIRAPFAGTIADLSVKVGDTVSQSSVVATVITSQMVAEIPLNEVDIASVKLQQKATLTFDAISDLGITGEVAEIDAIGTESQGVVSYNVKIVFDAQDERVKPGMSVSVAIITDMKQDVIVVSNSAVKQKGGLKYVEIFSGEDKAPIQTEIQTGLSNDTMTEITDGLKDGDKIVLQTISSDSSSAVQQSKQGANIGIPGMGGGFGGR